MTGYGLGDGAPFDDGRGKYPEAIRLCAPRGCRDHIRVVADQEGVSIGEFIRRAIGERLDRLTGGKDRDGYSGPVAA